MKYTGRLTLLLLGTVLLVLLLASPALAAPPVDGWQMTTLSDQAASSTHARVSGGRVVWVEGNTEEGTKIVLYDTATDARQVVATNGIEPEIEGDHVAYLGPAVSSSAGREGRDVFVHTISTGADQQLTSDAQTRFNWWLTIQGDKVLWESVSEIGIDAVDPAVASLFMHDLTTNETVTLATGETGGGPSLYVANSSWVVWNYYGASPERSLEVWAHSLGTGETRELVPLFGYQVLAIAGDTLMVSRTWGIYGGVEQFFTYDLRSGELRPFDKESNRPISIQGDGDLFAWAAYGGGSPYVALYDVRTGALTRVATPGYDAGGLVLRGNLLIWHGQFTGRYVGTAMHYLFVYDRARGAVTRLAPLFGSSDGYGTDGQYVAFPSGNGWWPSPWSSPLELLLASQAAPSVEPFLDVPGTHPYRTPIQGLKERGIVGGYPSPAGTEFRPDATLTRGQFAKMLALTLDIPVDPEAVAPFDDVDPGLFPGAYIAALATRGIAQGTTPKTFSPYATLTRAQLMTLLVRAIDAVKPGMLGSQPTVNWSPDYQGALGPFDPTHGPCMLRAELNGLVDGLIGYGRKWDPWKPATRAEAAQALWNFLGKEGRLAPGVSFVPSVSFLEPGSGPVAGGNTVIIAGNRLTGATAVTFGGTNATGFHVDSDNQITAVAPAHGAETVDVQVTTPAGSSATAGTRNDYTYTTALPAVILLSPTRGLTAGGTEGSAVIIEGTNLVGTTAVMFGTTAATSFRFHGNNEIYAVAPAHVAGTVDVIVINPNGASLPSAESLYEYVNVFPSPPVGKPVDVIRRTSPPYVWSAVVADQTVAHVESASYGFPSFQPPPQSAVIRTLDLETGNVSAVPGSAISSPAWENFMFWPWWYLAELPHPAGEKGAGPSLVWAVGNLQYSDFGLFRWQDLTGWNASGGTNAILSPESMTLPPIRTGDILALPLTSPAFENAHRGTVGTTLGEKLLVLTGSLDQPIAVDPSAPILPAAALDGISPYVSWSGWLLDREPPSQYAAQFRSDLPGKPPRVFDLRTGKLVDIAVKDPRTPEDWFASVVAGHWAAWVASESGSQATSLYLADLTTGQAQRLLDEDASGEIALSEDWLLWTDASGTLLGYHLADMIPVHVAGVLVSGEQVRNLQVTGDAAVLMVVNQETQSIGPDLPPRWTAIRVVRLR